MQYKLSDAWQGNIKQGDNILAMVTIGGKVIARLSGRTFSSVAEIMNRLRELADNNIGITQIFIRNYDEGWHVNQPVVLRAKQQSSFKNMGSVSMQGRQYVLSFH